MRMARAEQSVTAQYRSADSWSYVPNPWLAKCSQTGVQRMAFMSADWCCNVAISLIYLNGCAVLRELPHNLCQDTLMLGNMSTAL